MSTWHHDPSRRSIDNIGAQVERMLRAARIHANARRMLFDTKSYIECLDAAEEATEDEQVEAWDICAAHAEYMLERYGELAFARLDDLAYEYSK